MSQGIYTQDVTDILDLFFENDGCEPDWAAIKSRLFSATDSHYSLILNLLRSFHLIYEDEAAAKTLLWRLEQERTE
jgi:hypothetical protein